MTARDNIGNDTLHVYLGLWRDWMHGKADKLGYPGQSCGMGTGGASDDFDTLCERADDAAVRVMDAIIDELQPAPRAAVYHVWLGAVFRLRDMEGALAEGYRVIWREMAGKGLR